MHRPKGDVRATPLPQQHRPADRRKVLSLSPEKIRKKGMNIHAKEFFYAKCCSSFLLL